MPQNSQIESKTHIPALMRLGAACSTECRGLNSPLDPTPVHSVGQPLHAAPRHWLRRLKRVMRRCTIVADKPF
jgi:hypothetical protein